MGFDNMRSGHARLPTYIVAGLLLMSFLLMCNWWSLSSQNSDLLKQIDEMGSQLNICSDERVVCMSKRNSIETQLREMQSKALAIESTYKEEIARLKKQSATLEKASTNMKQDLTFCKTELDSWKKVDTSKEATLQSLRVEKDNLVSQLNLAKETISKLEEDIKTLNAKTAAYSSKNLPTPEAPKVEKDDVQDVLQMPAMGDGGPVLGVNHEINKVDEIGQADPPIESNDEDLEPDTGNRPPVKSQ